MKWYHGKIPIGYLYRVIFNHCVDLHQPKSASLQDAGAASAAFVVCCKILAAVAAGR